MTAFSLEDLASIISARTDRGSAVSYTKSLVEAGPARAAKKFGEEAIELVVAAVEADRAAIVSESADVLYHLLVVLHLAGVPLSEVVDELESRTRQSGHQEKAGRQSASR